MIKITWAARELMRKNMEQKSVADKTDKASQGKDVKLRIRRSYGNEWDPVQFQNCKYKIWLRNS